MEGTALATAAMAATVAGMATERDTVDTDMAAMVTATEDMAATAASIAMADMAITSVWDPASAADSRRIRFAR